MVTSINLVIMLIISVIITVHWIQRARYARPFVLTPTFGWLCAGAVVLASPLLWTPTGQFMDAVTRVAGLAAGLAVMLACLQLPKRHQTIWLYIILGSTVLQALVVIQQLLWHRDAWVPLYGRRVYGTFFQPNVLASYLATGLALAWTLLLLPHFTLNSPAAESLRRILLLILIGLFSVMLIYIQSRVGWLSAFLVTGLFIWRLQRYFPQRCNQAFLATIAGPFIGICILTFYGHTVPAISHDDSNLARWYMLRDTLAMLAQKPLTGWGYGGFEYDFQHYRIHKNPPTLITELSRHPHNEPLLWLVEGGLVALSGLLLLFTGLVRIVLNAIRRDRTAFAIGSPTAGLSTALCIALVPIALHTQLEFPFYLSAPHALVFLFLLAIVDRLGGERCAGRSSLRGLCVAMAIMAFVWAITATYALYGHIALSEVERFGMEDTTPLKSLPAPSRILLSERLMFDQQVNVLLTYNQTRDEELLAQYRQWAEGYLQQRINKNVYLNLIMILRHQHCVNEAERYRRDAARFFPDDIRFKSMAAGGNA